MLKTAEESNLQIFIVNRKEHVLTLSCIESAGLHGAFHEISETQITNFEVVSDDCISKRQNPFTCIFHLDENMFNQRITFVLSSCC